MPTWLREILGHLTDEQAEELWKYLDEDPNALESMIALTVDSHPTLMGGTKS